MNVIRLMRPQDWVKNLFVLLPILFWMAAPKTEGDDLSYVSASWLTLLTFVAFCLVASAVYSFNDALDANKDRTHPVKRLRPVASGAISPGAAMGIGTLLGIVGLVIGWITGFGVFTVLVLYVLMQVCYNGGAKYVVLVDVVVIAIGFVLRAAAGAFAIESQLSIWLLLCVFFLCLYLGFIKRLCDFASARRDRGSEWRSPAGYDNRLELNWLLGVSAVMSVMMYLTYALSTHATHLFGARAAGIALLTPLVIIVMHRFYRRANEGLSDSPLNAVLDDRVVQVGMLLYFLGVIATLYIPAVGEVLGKLLIGPSG